MGATQDLSRFLTTEKTFKTMKEEGVWFRISETRLCCTSNREERRMKTTFNLNEGWQISSSLSFSYNHEAQSIQEWALPVGFDVSKTSVLGGRQQVYSAPEVTAFVQIKA